MLTTGDVATLLGVSDQAIRDLIAKGVLPSERLSDTGRYRVRKDLLIEYAQNRGITLDWTKLSK